MDPQTTRRFVPLPSARVPAVIVGMAVAVSATAHAVAAATGPPGAMAGWMAVMGAACLACAAPLVAGRGSASPRLVGRRCIGRAAGHLLIMSTAMILIHLVLLTAPGAGHHHGPANAAGSFTVTTHNGAMLALIGVELLCLVAASAALRMTRANTAAGARAAARSAVKY